MNSGANITFNTKAVTISQLIMAKPGNLDSIIPSTHLISLLKTIQKNDGSIWDYKGGTYARTHVCLTVYRFCIMTLSKKAMFTFILLTLLQRTDPVSKVYYPVFNTFEDDRKTVAIMLAWIQWSFYFENVLSPALRGLYIVLKDSCGGDYTYIVNGHEVIPIGRGDLHATGYDELKHSIGFENVDSIADGTEFGVPFNKEFCPISIDIYPSKVRS